jgi:hypothetical protein
VPAPAVIPAPKAYINAVAVKGFVVELGADSSKQWRLAFGEAQPLFLQPANIRNKHHGIVIFLPKLTRAMYAGGRP